MKLRSDPVFEEADKGGGAGATGDKGDKGSKPPARTAIEGAGDDKGGGGEPPARLTELPEYWRDLIVDPADEAMKNEFARIKSPRDLAKRFMDQRAQISKGADAVEEAPDGEKDPEALTLWRAKHGIPNDPTGYVVPDEIKTKLSDADKPIVDGYMQWAHKRNMSPKEVQRGIEYYTGLQEALAADQAEVDKGQKTETEQRLRSTWGADTRNNARLAAAVAKSIVPGVDFFMCRDPATGRMLGNIPEFVEAMHEVGVLQGRQADYEDSERKGGADELATLKEKMKDRSAWRADKKGQARYLELMEQQERRASR